jgi:hypothetical protein
VNEGTQFGDGYAGGGGTPFLKYRGGGKLLARKWAGGWKKVVGTKVFCTHMEGTKNIYCKFDGKREEGTEWEVYKRGLPLITYYN